MLTLYKPTLSVQLQIGDQEGFLRPFKQGAEGPPPPRPRTRPHISSCRSPARTGGPQASQKPRGTGRPWGRKVVLLRTALGPDLKHTFLQTFRSHKATPCGRQLCWKTRGRQAQALAGLCGAGPRGQGCGGGRGHLRSSPPASPAGRLRPRGGSDLPTGTQREAARPSLVTSTPTEQGPPRQDFRKQQLSHTSASVGCRGDAAGAGMCLYIYF